MALTVLLDTSCIIKFGYGVCKKPGALAVEVDISPPGTVDCLPLLRSGHEEAAKEARQLRNAFGGLERIPL
eukprot:7074039-Prorocentrum_lima.AAC.1